MKLNKLIIAARKYLGGAMQSSALSCLEDSIRLKNKGKYKLAGQYALRSLVYSVGILSPVYAENYRLLHGKNAVVKAF